MSDVSDEAESEPALAEVRRFAVKVAAAKAHDFDPEDIAQDVMEKYVRQAGTVKHWRAWIRTTTDHRIIDLRRAGRRDGPEHDRKLADLNFGLAQAVNGPSGGVIARHLFDEVLARLTDRDRDVMREHLGGATNREIADLFGYASSAVVATLIARIRNKIKDLFPDGVLEPERMYDLRRRPGRFPQDSDGG